MALVYKGAVLHDGSCSCCELTDAAPQVTDPTGTGPIRRNMVRAFSVKWRKVKVAVRTAIVTQDMLGLGEPTSLGNIVMVQSVISNVTKMQIFQRWLDKLISDTVVQNVESSVRPFISRAYAKGVAFGNKQASTNLYPHGSETEQTIEQLAHIELQGVAEAVSQQALRVLTEGMLIRSRPARLARDIGMVIDKVGMGRVNDIANVLIVRAFSDATLDVYEQAGIEEVGTIPEVIRNAGALDAKAKARARTQKRKARKAVAKRGAGSRVRGRTPSARTIGRIEQEQAEIEKLGKRVNIITAGDDRVCPFCEQLEEMGPYSINTARSLIPAHPRCRCAFVPVKKSPARKGARR